MELRVLLLFIILGTATLFSVASGATKKRRVIIHIPVKVKQKEHVHTVLKQVHHHHKPTVIEREKIIKQEVIKPLPVKNEIEHEHVHHHYKHDHFTQEYKDAELSIINDQHRYESAPRPQVVTAEPKPPAVPKPTVPEPKKAIRPTVKRTAGKFGEKTPK